MILTGWQIIISIVIIVLLTLGIRKLFSDSKLTNSCVTCGALPSKDNVLIRCSECDLLFCENGAEELAEAIIHTTVTIQSKPPQKNTGFPCGTKLIIIEINKPQTEIRYCRKHSPRPPFAYKVVPVS